MSDFVCQTIEASGYACESYPFIPPCSIESDALLDDFTLDYLSESTVFILHPSDFNVGIFDISRCNYRGEYAEPVYASLIPKQDYTLTNVRFDSDYMRWESPIVTAGVADSNVLYSRVDVNHIPSCRYDFVPASPFQTCYGCSGVTQSYMGMCSPPIHVEVEDIPTDYTVSQMLGLENIKGKWILDLFPCSDSPNVTLNQYILRFQALSVSYGGATAEGNPLYYETAGMHIQNSGTINGTFGMSTPGVSVTLPSYTHDYNAGAAGFGYFGAINGGWGKHLIYYRDDSLTAFPGFSCCYNHSKFGYFGSAWWSSIDVI